jgi:hypothetical protein
MCSAFNGNLTIINITNNYNITNNITNNFNFTNNITNSFKTASGYQGIYGPGVQQGDKTIEKFNEMLNI